MHRARTLGAAEAVTTEHYAQRLDDGRKLAVVQIGDVPIFTARKVTNHLRIRGGGDGDSKARR